MNTLLNKPSFAEQRISHEKMTLNCLKRFSAIEVLSMMGAAFLLERDALAVREPPDRQSPCPIRVKSCMRDDVAPQPHPVDSAMTRGCAYKQPEE